MRLTLPLLWCSLASATTLTVATPPGTFFNLLPVDATATLQIEAGHVTITLNNLEVNPKSVVQNLSDFGFVFADPSDLDMTFDSGSLVSSSGLERTIASNGTYTDGDSASTGWMLFSDHHFDSFGKTGILLNLLGTGTAPTHTIVGLPGPGGYTNANPSLKGVHNPFLFGPVTFEVDVPGLSANSILLGAEFSFNTSAGYAVDAQPQPVPEPSGLGLIGIALIAGAALLRRALVRC